MRISVDMPDKISHRDTYIVNMEPEPHCEIQVPEIIQRVLPVNVVGLPMVSIKGIVP